MPTLVGMRGAELSMRRIDGEAPTKVGLYQNRQSRLASTRAQSALRGLRVRLGFTASPPLAAPSCNACSHDSVST